MEKYETPTVTELGTVQDLTLNVYKTKGSGDIIYVDGTEIANVGPTAS
jgi:sporulation protein YlmC with PRC-barrel domain